MPRTADTCVNYINNKFPNSDHILTGKPDNALEVFHTQEQFVQLLATFSMPFMWTKQTEQNISFEHKSLVFPYNSFGRKDITPSRPPTNKETETIEEIQETHLKSNHFRLLTLKCSKRFSSTNCPDRTFRCFQCGLRSQLIAFCHFNADLNEKGLERKRKRISVMTETGAASNTEFHVIRSSPAHFSDRL